MDSKNLLLVYVAMWLEQRTEQFFPETIFPQQTIFLNPKSTATLRNIGKSSTKQKTHQIRLDKVRLALNTPRDRVIARASITI